MNDLLKTSIAVVLVINLMTILGCSTDEGLNAEVWQTFETEETGITNFKKHSVAVDLFGNTYVIQDADEDGKANLHYRLSSGAWIAKNIDHTQNPNFGSIGDRMQATLDGSVWLLT